MNKKQLYTFERAIKKASLSKFKDIGEDQFVGIKQELLDSYPKELLFEFTLNCAHSCEPLCESVYLSLDTQCSGREDYYLSVYGLDIRQISFHLDDEPFKAQLRDCLGYLRECLNNK